MAKYEVGFDGRWQETFDDRSEAIEWAQEVAETGRVVDVVLKRRFLPRKFLTAFPESKRAAREAAWTTLYIDGGVRGFGGW
jgi:hypothetical protein